ncbi:SusC/RagA family TonB-linked outer membrane protein [Chitinophaga qingshengii]|uniref:SusC/RagA family TonB-linked outer membrane protein n=1 Tax=Chitinophaga qingshengii TaxID=1569794 RepID=A0ABR7TM78_9BACT|nr:SusC/RagA family TonB-linked outer membrane protein [Chitinophaga qingshengii]MBC9930597.1 SusC/RagA family TonB-linked outer membrane protein [Chitinophaga qingshengii]
MKLIMVLLTAGFMHVCAKGVSQSISFSGRNVPLETVFSAVKQQTGYVFMYTEPLLRVSNPVTTDEKNVPLEKFLTNIFSTQPLQYNIKGKTIFVYAKALPLVPAAPAVIAQPITGRITDADGQPLPGATVVVKGTTRSAPTNADGVFTLSVNPGEVLVISFIGYEKKEYNVTAATMAGHTITVSLARATSVLDDVQVIAYGTTTRRLSTGSIAKIRGEDIRKQPVESPLLALGGRLPGVQISQTSGLAGAPVSVTIRGKSSLGAGSEPLYVIDGVPFAHALGSVTLSNGLSAQTMGGMLGATAGTSPFVSLNPADIESIEVLKDADATAIYGSRGANGVVLITTRKAKAGKTNVDASYYTGWARPTRMPRMMNTQQYVTMRKEAFRNDGIVPTTSNATDLMLWDTTRYTDWSKMLVGKQARSNDAQVRISGGNQQTQASLAAGFHRETPIYYGDMSDNRANVHTSIVHRSTDSKFSVSFNASYNTDKNNIITTDLMQLLTTIPNAPYPFDSSGNLVWRDQGISFSNPLAYTFKKFIANTDNLLGSMNMRYQVMNGLQLKVDAGFNSIRVDQTATNPLKSQSPFSTTANSTADFFSKKSNNWIIEPQAEYSHTWGKAAVQVLAGGSFQEQLNQETTINASGYANDDLLMTPGPAATKNVSSAYNKYHYAALFGRVSMNWDGKYLLNASARHDGSSRFGPGKQFGTFGAIGAGWVFSEEKFMKGLSFLSFGKLRASMGVTGNDRIPDYAFLAQWRSVNAAIPYQGTSGLYPYNLFNPDYAWERNRKWEAALELSFLKERIYVSANYYLNKTDNQLTGLTLPSQVGFTSLTANRDAILQNSGWELMLSTTNMEKKNFSWKTTFNITVPRNKLLAYPGLEDTYYASIFSIGQPVTISKFIPNLGVDPKTGVYQLGGMAIPKDQTQSYDMAQRHYGGLQNTVTYKNWTLDFFFHFVKQRGKTAILFQAPGSRSNQPVEMLDRWQHPDDITDVQRFTTTGIAATTYSYYANYSDGRVANASFVRLKNVSLSYQFDRRIARRIKAENIRVYAQGQNLLTFTHYKIGDPETMSFSSMPPMRMLTIGAQVSF